MATWRAETLLTDAVDDQLGPWALEHAFRAARAEVKGLPAGWPDSDDSTRAAIDKVMAARGDNLRTSGGQ